MKIFITGATGFIGTNLVNLLAGTEHQMHCLIRNPNKASELIEKGASIALGDVTDKASILRGMKGCDWVINLANIYSFWEPDRQVYKKVNVEGTRNVMECALETGVSKVIHVSTVAVFGKPADCPFTEGSSFGPVRFSEYAETKYLGELAAWELFKEKGLPLVVVYPALVTGSGDPKDFSKYIFNLINHRLPATVFDNSIMTLVHVKDVAGALLKALEKENNIGEKYIIGKYKLSYKELFQMINEISGASMPRLSLPNSVTIANAAILTLLANLVKRPPLWQLSVDLTKTNIAGIVCDGSKAERELGLNYTPIHQALEETIASFKK